MASVFYLARMSCNVTPSLIDPTVRSSYPTTAVRSGEKDVRISVIGSIRVTHDMQQEHRRRILLNFQVTTPRLCYVLVFKVPQHCFERAGLSRSFVFVATTHSRPAHARNTTEATPGQGEEVLYKVRPYNGLSSMLAELESASVTRKVVEPKLPEPCLTKPKLTRFSPQSRSLAPSCKAIDEVPLSAFFLSYPVFIRMCSRLHALCLTSVYCVILQNFSSSLLESRHVCGISSGV